jgi:transcriptional regulator with XRE-family HTH domain
MYGKLLKQFTIDTGISQKEVADRLSFSTQRVNHYYRDKADPPREFLEQFRAEFSVDLRAAKNKEEKGIKAGVAAFNPIPVYDFTLKPVKGTDFFNHSELVSYYIDAPMFNDCFAAVMVPDEAMTPTLKPTDIIAIKKITNLETAPLGDHYLIITEEQRLVRILRKNPSDPKRTFLLKAANPEYDDMTISRSTIKHLFQIRGKISRL